MPISNCKTQKSLKEYFRKVIDNIGLCESVKTKHSEYYSDFIELFVRHPDYPDKIFGMVDIQIKLNPIYKNLELCILYENGDCNDISYNLCVTGKPKNKLKTAMRVSIQYQIDEYRDNNNSVCETCQTTYHIQVDHIVWFEKLYDDFMKINTLPLPTLFDETEGHLKCFTSDDDDFKNNWNHFHNEHAVLRMLCKSCNTSRPKYKRE